MAEDEGTNFPNQKTINLADNPGVVELGTFEAIRGWAQTEINWSNHFKNRVKHPSAQEVCDHQLEPAINIVNLVNEALKSQSAKEQTEYGKNILKELKHYREYDVVHSESEWGKLARQIEDKEPWAGIGALAASIGHSLEVFHGHANIDINVLQRIITGYQILQSTYPETEQLEALNFRHDVNELVTETKKKIAESEASIAESASEASSIIDESRNNSAEQEQKFSSLYESYNAYLKLDSPAKYWGARAARNNIWVFGLMIVFALLAASGAVTALTVIPGILKNLYSIESNVGLAGVSVVTVPALAFFWFMALLWKITSGKMAVAEASEERSVMVQAYMSFLRDEHSPVDEEHRKIILDRLFEPIGGNGKSNSAHPSIELARILREQAKELAGG